MPGLAGEPANPPLQSDERVGRFAPSRSPLNGSIVSRKKRGRADLRTIEDPERGGVARP